jgi:hypothetical protein
MLTIGACDSPVRAQVWQDRHFIAVNVDLVAVDAVRITGGCSG